jgi:hypothetical protein
MSIVNRCAPKSNWELYDATPCWFPLEAQQDNSLERGER